MTTQEIKDLIKYHSYMMHKIGESQAYKNRDQVARNSYTSHLDKKFKLEGKLKGVA